MSHGPTVLNGIDVGNDPVNAVDPWGLFSYSDPAGSTEISHPNGVPTLRDLSKKPVIPNASFDLEARQQYYQRQLGTRMESLGGIRVHVAVPSTGESIARIAAALIPVIAECQLNFEPLFIPELDILPYSSISP